MILNVSRAKTFRLCKRKAFNTYHRKLTGPRSMNLVDGGAFHKGVAAGRASKDWDKALAEADKQFDEDVKVSTIPEEQLYLIEQHRDLVHKMINCFKEQYEHEQYQIVQPECEFDVALPHTWHNCIMMHWQDEFGKEHWEAPSPMEILGRQVFSPHLNDSEAQKAQCKCWQPHRFTGRTDALVVWNHNLWIDDYKTTSIAGEQFWDQWFVDFQMTAYLYGVWRQLKTVRPRGFLLNAIHKPSEAQVNNWNSRRKNPAENKTIKDYIQLNREAFFRSEEDLGRVEKQLIQVCYEWEREITDHQAAMQFDYTFGSHSCTSYNRKCDFWTSCQSHDAVEDLEAMVKREDDYVDVKLSELVPQART